MQHASRPEIHELGSAAETEAVAAELARSLDAGDVVLLSGEVGAGKTTFVRGACRALGVSGPITSPTFTIGRRYEGRVPISHLDLYRVGSLADEEPGLLDEYLDPATIAFIEWPEAAQGELEGISVRVVIEHAGGDQRRIRISR